MIRMTILLTISSNARTMLIQQQATMRISIFVGILVVHVLVVTLLLFLSTTTVHSFHVTERSYNRRTFNRCQQHQQRSQNALLLHSSRSSLSSSSGSSDNDADPAAAATTAATTTATTTIPTNENVNVNTEITTNSKKKVLYPNVGDIVQYYDIDGGNVKGQVLIGKITFIYSTTTTTTATNSNNNNSNNNDSKSSSKQWYAEIMELDRLPNNVQDDSTTTATTTTDDSNSSTKQSTGWYYTEYSNYQQRGRRPVLRAIINDNISPVLYVMVRYNNMIAYKISVNPNTQQPLLKQEQYDIDIDYVGPFTTTSSTSSTTKSLSTSINNDILVDDAMKYQQLKIELLRNTLLFGIVGTIITALLTKGNIEDIILYTSGVLASIGYIYFLSLKTDTLATNDNAKFGKAISNIRFITPIIPLVFVSIYNSMYHTTTTTDIASSSSSLPSTLMIQQDLFKLVSTEQFFAIMIGFLSYRIPLFFTQIQQSFASSSTETSSSSISISENDPNGTKSTTTATSSKYNAITPGKVSLIPTMDNALVDKSPNDSYADNQQTKQMKSNMNTMKPLFPTMKLNTKTQKKEVVATIFVISGPSCTGRTELVQRFVQESKGQFVLPTYIDRYNDTAKFESIQDRDGFLYLDPSEQRFGLTRDSLLNDIQNISRTSSNSVLILDTNVDFAIQLSQMGGVGLRLVAVWVTLTSIEAFVKQINTLIDTQQQSQNEAAITMSKDQRNVEIRTRTTQIVQEIELGISSGIFEFTIIHDTNNMEQSLKELRDASKYCFV